MHTNDRLQSLVTLAAALIRSGELVSHVPAQAAALLREIEAIAHYDQTGLDEYVRDYVKQGKSLSRERDAKARAEFS